MLARLPDLDPPSYDAAASLVIHIFFFKCSEKITIAHSKNKSCSKPLILFWLCKHASPSPDPTGEVFVPVWFDSELFTAWWTPGQERSF